MHRTVPAAPSSGSFCAAEMQHVAEQVLGMSDIMCRLKPEAVRKLRQTCRAARDAELSEQYWRDAVRERFPGLVAEAAQAASHEIFYTEAVRAGVSSDAIGRAAAAQTDVPSTELGDRLRNALAIAQQATAAGGKFRDSEQVLRAKRQRVVAKQSTLRKEALGHSAQLGEATANAEAAKGRTAELKALLAAAERHEQTTQDARSAAQARVHETSVLEHHLGGQLATLDESMQSVQIFGRLMADSAAHATQLA
eukprot:COSAG06_NODE_17991_length_909_cov_1.654321_1_plen_251_part_10